MLDIFIYININFFFEIFQNVLPSRFLNLCVNFLPASSATGNVYPWWVTSSHLSHGTCGSFQRTGTNAPIWNDWPAFPRINWVEVIAHFLISNKKAPKSCLVKGLIIYQRMFITRCTLGLYMQIFHEKI